MREIISWRWAGSGRRRSVIAVTIGPGWTELARMLSRAYWIAVAFVKRRTAPLEAWYCGLLLSVPTRRSWDEMLTNDRRTAGRMDNMTALVPKNTPVALTSITRLPASTVVPKIRIPPPIPA